MAGKNIPPSPNWFLSAASDANESGVYVYAVKQDVCVFDVSEPTLRVLGPKLLGTYREHTDRVSGVALSPVLKDGCDSQEAEGEVGANGEAESDSHGQEKSKGLGSLLCCSGGDDKAVKIWTVDGLVDVQAHYEHKERVTSVCWSPVDINLVASGDDKGEVIFWDRKTNTLKKWHHNKDYVTCLAFCPHEPTILAVGLRIGTVCLVDFAHSNGSSLVHRLRGHDEEVMSMSWCPVPGETFLRESPDGTNALSDPNRDRSGCMLATGSRDRTIRVWTLSQGKQAFMKKVPGTRREGSEQGPRVKQWVAVHWLKSNPELLASSSAGGDFLLWTLRHAKGLSYQTFDPAHFRPQMRPIFNICASGSESKILCTFAQDRQVVFWNVDSMEAVSSLSTLGGHVYCVRNSPIDPGRVAVGVGDSMIRVWNTSNKSNPYDISVVWQGIKSKVTAVAWHPTREGWLAFGTEDGRVGVHDVLSHKMPTMSNTFHRHTVYVLCWGPSTQSPEDTKNYSLYTVGDCKVLEHSSAVLSRGSGDAEAINFTEKVVSINSDQITGIKATEISWNMTMDTAAIGADDGSVYIVSARGLKLLAVVKVQKKLLHCTRWHPLATEQSPSSSPCRNWMVVAGNSQTLDVVDLSAVLEREGEMESLQILSSLRELSGHCGRVTDLCWSPHHDGRLVSVGYEAEVFVWDVQRGTALGQFRGHWGHVQTCQFSGLDPDLVMTGGTDSMLRVWRVSELTAPEFGERRKRKRKKTHAAAAAASLGTAAPKVMEREDGNEGDKVSETESTTSEQQLQELQEALDRKRQDLMQQQSDGGQRGDGLGQEGQGVSGVVALSDSKAPGPGQGQSELQPPSAVVSHPPTSSLSSESSPPPTTTPSAQGPPMSSEEDSSDGSEVDGEGGEGEGRRVKREGQSVPSSVRFGNVRVAKGRGGGGESGRKRRRQKGYFPQTAQAENTSRGATHLDLLWLTRHHFPSTGTDEGEKAEGSSRGEGGEEEAKRGGGGVGPSSSSNTTSTSAEGEEGEDRFHLGLFTHRAGAYRCLQQEVNHHLSHANMEYAFQMELWKGNITGVIQMARERAQLSDWIVALAPLASYETWERVCEEYARQLEEEGQYHKAVSYLLVSHKLYPAIDLFRRHKLFREAVALAHVRLSLQDPVWEDLYNDWSQQLMRDGAYEQAAKCYLAMKRIQDAAQAITRRSDQSSLKTACHMTLAANDKQQGQLYAQQVVTRFLLGRQWEHCLTFLREHQPLKVFIPYVSVHEMMMRELTCLLPDFVSGAPSDFQNAATWDSTAADKMGLPEFILDPREADPVLLWEPYLVSGRTFPHHVLRVWHLCLGVAMETEELHLVYHALQQLQSGRQAHLDTQQVLLQVCVDVTLWLLALLTNQTTLAISHLLGALSALHDGGHHHLLTALCRLLLPQGPKYSLKLQQEATALRVLINMESQGDVDGGGGGGGSKHLSLRRYLSELKDEASVSTGALRCKQLDCVRAYHYLSVLHFLQTTYHTSSQDARRPQTTAPPTPSTPSPPILASPVEGGMVVVAAPQRTGVFCERGVDVDSEAGREELQSAKAGSEEDGGATTTTVATSKGGDVGKDGDGGSSVDLPQVGRRSADDGGDDDGGRGERRSSDGGEGRVSLKGTGSCEDLTTVAVSGPADRAQSWGDSETQATSCVPGESETRGRDSRKGEEVGGRVVGVVDPSQLSLARLLQLSKGLLWDVQAKRLALTDTLGHIHRAISAHLLTDPSRQAARTLSRHPQAPPAAATTTTTITHHGPPHHHHPPPPEELDKTSNFAPVLADTVAAHLPAPPLMDMDPVGDPTSPSASSSSPPHSQCQGGGGGGEAITNSAVLLPSLSSSPLPSASLLSTPAPIPSPPSATTRDCGGGRRAGDDHRGGLEPLPDSNFDLDLVTRGQQSDGSRRVLWQDDPVSGSGGRGGEGRWGGGGDSSAHKPTSLLSPGKYINVPDEWYSLPVDDKYGRSYVTLAVLKDEQDFVMGELKRLSDSSQVPFPNPFQSVEALLTVCLMSDSQLLTSADKHNYIHSLQSWAMHFAVTAQQRTKTETLFASAQKDLGL
ncbi:gem-associated protein 5-like [Babylonia areolata]|uniref:gem-associated protein 5-like n=1 Tax=Babylonia areolata TaxID=304850 RepID=UPI003FD50197